MIARVLRRLRRVGSTLRRRRRKPGVNVVGYHHVASGLGQVARDLVATLSAAGVPCVAVDVAETASPTHRLPAPAPPTLCDTTVAVVTAPQLPGAMEALPEVRAAQRRLIGYWFWELEEVPPDHGYAIGLVDEIWTATEFIRHAYASVPDGPPVRLVPVLIPEPDIDPQEVERWRSALTRTDHDVLFVVSLDLLSVMERKNPIGAIEAFRRAFPAPPNGEAAATSARLVIKTINGAHRPDDLDRLVDAAGDDPRITVLDRFVESSELEALIAAADVYVSLHRSEGLGLHLATAMWVGTPVIATRWSGNLDLMDDDAAALIDVEFVGVTGGGDAYPADAVWADPDLDQAATWMRRLANEPDTAAALAASARQRMAGRPDAAELGEQLAHYLSTGSFSTR